MNVRATHRGAIGAAILSLFYCIPSAGLAAVGRTPGMASVSQTGAATYSIPLWTAPGINGLQPTLALNYDSNRGNGLLGVGWDISGLSTIHRCYKTWEQDGKVAPGDRSNADRLCLDGQQLRLDGGVYGKDGSTYRTEIESFARITGMGASSNTVAWFKVESKDGLIYEYGNSANARIEYSGNATLPRLWALSRIRDRAGNYIEFTYTEDNVNGVYRISEIAYPYSSTIQTPSYRVRFVYETRPAADPSVIAPTGGGGKVKETNRLDRIEMDRNEGGWQLTKKYDLSYESGAASSRSRISQIQECSSDDCLAPTVFTYSNGQIGVDARITIAVTLLNSLPIDINGDGYTDLIYPNAGYWYYRLGGESSALSTAYYSNVSATYANTALPLDYDSDGKMDFAQRSANGVWEIVRFTTTGAFLSTTQTGRQAIGADGMSFAGDLNGDGRADLFYAQVGATTAAPDQIYWYRNNGNGFDAAQLWYSTNSNGDSKFANANPLGSVQTRFRTPVRIADFNGDGATDLLIYLKTDTSTEDGGPPVLSWDWIVDASGQGQSGAFNDSSTTHPNVDPIPTELNGDSCADLMWASPAGTWRFALSRCGGSVAAFDASLPTTIPTTNHERAVMLDWDGDGRTDILVPNGSIYTWYRSLGDSFAAGVPTSVTPPNTTGFARVGDFNGDGLTDIASTAPALVGDPLYLWLHLAGTTDLLATATDAFGMQAAFTYRGLNSGNACYVRGQDPLPAFPMRAYMGSLDVVCSVSASSGNGGTYQVNHTYYDANVHLQGRGFLGFARKDASDSRDGILHREDFRQDFPFIGMTSNSSEYQAAGGPLMRQSVNTFAAHAYRTGYQSGALPYVSQSVAKDYEVGGAFNGQLIRTATTTNIVDSASGAVSDSTTTVTEAATANGLNAGATHTSRTYHSALFTDLTNWCLGRPTATQQINSHSLSGGSEVTRSWSRLFDGPMCRLTKQVTEPGSTKWEVTADYLYDGFGNVATVTATPAPNQGQLARTTTIDWGPTGQFPQSMTNPKSQQTLFGWNFALGLLTSATDPNSQVYSWDYNGFGQKTREDRPDGTATDYVRGACSSTNNYCGSADLRWSVQLVTRDTGENEIRSDSRYFDGFDRVRYDYRQMLGGASSGTITQYDALGRVAAQSTPFVSADPVWYTSYVYDLLSRPTRVERQASEIDTSAATLLIAYEGLKTVTTNTRSHSSSQIHNAIGEVVQSFDAAGSDTEYEYDSFGNLRKTKDFYGNEIVLTYNARGMKLTSLDPDMGSWAYDYYPFGELKSQTDAKGLQTTFEHDALSRLVKRIEGGTTTNFSWDTAAHGKGQLASVSDGTYAETYLYDAVSRPAQILIAIDGSTHQYDFAYQSTTGLLDTLTYPASVGTAPFKVRYGYDHGHLASVQNYTGNSAGTTYWQSLGMNARGQTLLEQFGNGLQASSGYDRISGVLDDRLTGPGANGTMQNLAFTWDKAGNLIARRDLNLNLTEEFGYDSRDRLDFSTLNGAINLDVSYDETGNITSKSDVGTYTYDPAHKHAVASTSGLINKSYQYDANGNMISRDGYATTWTAYNYPSVINGPGKTLTFSYGPNRQRYRQVYNHGSVTETATYIGGALEKVTIAGTTDWRHYVSGGDGKVAVVIRHGDGTTTTRYMVEDHQGSVSEITDSSGAGFVSESFTAFGARRNADTWAGACPCADLTKIKSVTQAGFTGHEAVGGVSMGLIHMNGRVYDTAIGRFMSADPYVQAPYNSQSLNRYSYTFNNPLSSIDPSGFQTSGPDDGGGNNSVVDDIASGFISRTGGARNSLQQPCARKETCLQGSWSVEDTIYMREHSGQGASSRPSSIGIFPGRVNPCTDCQNSMGRSAVGGAISSYTPLFRDNFAGRVLQSFDNTAGILAAPFRDGEVRGLLSNLDLTGRELQDAKMGLVLAAVPLSRLSAGASGGQLLFRYRRGFETVTRLGRAAAEAEAKIGVHGVSVTSNPIAGRPCGVACRDAVEKLFPVLKTGADPDHYTVILPRPVTKEVADLFNELFRDVP